MINPIVDIVLSIHQRVPVPIRHNLAKARMLSILFYQLNLDKTPGDYFEFGVASGNSMRAASLAIKHSHFKTLGVSAMSRNLYGFDTFSEFKSDAKMDDHPVFAGKSYSSSYKSVSKRFKRRSDINLFELDVCSIDKVTDLKIPNDSCVALALLDMDLYSPTKSALNWIQPRLQVGSYLLLDDYYYFRGSRTRGERRAWLEFLAENPNIKVELVDRYGAGGQVFIIEEVSR